MNRQQAVQAIHELNQGKSPDAVFQGHDFNDANPHWLAVQGEQPNEEYTFILKWDCTLSTGEDEPVQHVTVDGIEIERRDPTDTYQPPRP